jgi:hypothetical protein
MSHGTRERRARARIDSIYNAERPQRNKLPSVTHELTIRRSNILCHSSHSSDLMYTTCEHTNTRDASERRELFYFTVYSLLLPSSSPHNTGTPSIEHRNISTLLRFVLLCSIRSSSLRPNWHHHVIEPLCDALCTEDSLRNTSAICGGHRCTRSEEGGSEAQGRVAGVKNNIYKFCGRGKRTRIEHKPHLILKVGPPPNLAKLLWHIKFEAPDRVDPYPPYPNPLIRLKLPQGAEQYR